MHKHGNVLTLTLTLSFCSSFSNIKINPLHHFELVAAPLIQLRDSHLISSYFIYNKTMYSFCSQIIIEMPNLKQLRTIAERLKKFSNFVNVFANSVGRLTFNVETSMASVSTHFKDLQVKRFNGKLYLEVAFVYLIHLFSKGNI